MTAFQPQLVLAHLFAILEDKKEQLEFVSLPVGWQH